MNIPKEILEAVHILNTEYNHQNRPQNRLDEAGLVVVKFALTVQDGNDLDTLLLGIRSNPRSFHVICVDNPFSAALATRYNNLHRKPTTPRQISRTSYRVGAQVLVNLWRVGVYCLGTIRAVNVPKNTPYSIAIRPKELQDRSFIPAKADTYNMSELMYTEAKPGDLVPVPSRASEDQIKALRSILAS